MTLREFIMNESCCGKACKGEFDAAKDFDEKLDVEEPEVKDDAEKDADGEEFEFVAKIKVNAADADEAKAKLNDALADFDAKIKAKKAEKEEDKEEDEDGDAACKNMKPAKKFKACPACGKNPCECK